MGGHLKPKTEPISLMDFAIDSADAVDGKPIIADTISPTKYLGPRSAFKTFATAAMTVVTIAASNPVVQGSAALWALSGFPGIDTAREAVTQTVVKYQVSSPETTLVQSIQAAKIQEAVSGIAEHFDPVLLDASGIRSMVQGSNYVGAIVMSARLLNEFSSLEEREAVEHFSATIYSNFQSSLVRKRVKAAIELSAKTDVALRALIDAIHDADISDIAQRKNINELTETYLEQYRGEIAAYQDLDPLLQIEVAAGSMVAESLHESIDGMAQRQKASARLYASYSSAMKRFSQEDSSTLDHLRDVFTRPLTIEQSFRGGANKLETLKAEDSVQSLLNAQQQKRLETEAEHHNSLGM